MDLFSSVGGHGREHGEALRDALSVHARQPAAGVEHGQREPRRHLLHGGPARGHAGRRVRVQRPKQLRVHA